MAKQKIRIRLKAYDHKILDQSRACRSSKPPSARVRRWPGRCRCRRRSKGTSVIRGPFIDKNSQEQFEIRTHKRLIDVLGADARRRSAR